MEYAYISRLVKVHVVYFLIVVLVWSMEYPKKGILLFYRNMYFVEYVVWSISKKEYKGWSMSK